MILVDTSVWVGHLRDDDPQLTALLNRAEVLMHPFVLGEIACGSLSTRGSVLALLRQLPAAAVASSDEVLGFIERHDLHGHGVGYVDVHLLASVALRPGTRLWTRDRRLRGAAERLGCSLERAAGR